VTVTREDGRELAGSLPEKPRENRAIQRSTADLITTGMWTTTG